MKLHDEVHARLVDQKTLNGWEPCATVASFGAEYRVYFDPAAPAATAFIVVSCPAGPRPVTVREQAHGSYCSALRHVVELVETDEGR